MKTNQSLKATRKKERHHFLRMAKGKKGRITTGNIE